MSLLALRAEAEAELLQRLRAPATLVALLAILAGSSLLLPRDGRLSSISWTALDGRPRAPVFDSTYAAWGSAVLCAVFLVMAAFYLVTGSLRRDRQSGLGVILAATPLSSGAFLAGRGLAHAAYLGTLCLLAVGVTLLRFLWFGAGPLRPVDFVLSFLLFTLPGVLFVSMLTLLWEVTPGLRGRAGLVAWFFAGSMILLVLPLGLPAFDPLGLMRLQDLMRAAIAGQGHSLALGLMVREVAPERVPWVGPQVGPLVAAERLLMLAWCLVPLFAARALFDRFDPARVRPLSPRPARGLPDTREAADSQRAVTLAPLAAGQVRPRPWLSLGAEAALIWVCGSWLRWPLLLSAVAGAVAPARAATAFLLLLVPVISEAAARERLAGAEGLLRSLPGLPRWPVTWKAGSLGLFLLGLALPTTLSLLATAPRAALGLVLGVAATALLCAALGSLSGGGKAWSALHVLAWYGAVNRAPEMDFTGGLLAPGASPITSAGWLAAGLLLLGLAAWAEVRRGAGA